MHDARIVAVPLGLLIGAVLLNGGKKTSWLRLPRLVKATKTKQGTTYSAFLPAKPKKKSARKRR